MTELQSKRGCLGFLTHVFGPPRQREEVWPYRRKTYLLSKAEFSFYRVLQQAAQPRYVVCPKVGLGDLLMIAKGTTNWQSWRNKIDRKHADFVLCEAETMKPAIVVELDDASHKGERAVKRDADKDRALKAAGLPLLRVPAKRSYDVGTLVANLNRQLTDSD